MAEPTAKGEVVPFGKYKGQPVEVLLADDGYRDWLMSQDWFRNRFGNIYQTIINYGGEPQETPEHNEMQASFLDDERCFRLANLLWPARSFDQMAVERSHAWRTGGGAFYIAAKEHLRPHFEPPWISGRKFEASGWDVVYRVVPTSLLLETVSLPGCSCGKCDHTADCPGSSPCRGGDLPKHYCRHGHERRIVPTLEWAAEKLEGRPYVHRRSVWGWTDANNHCSKSCIWSKEELGNWLLGDAEEWRLYAPDAQGSVLVECKPDLGDDFPAVLRQVSNYRSEHADKRCVVVRRSAFEKVTWKQVASMFGASGIVLLREAELLTDPSGNTEQGADD